MSSPVVQHRENQLRLVDQLCDGFESAWKAGARPSLSHFMERLEPELRPHAFDELLAIDVAYRRAGGEQPAPADYAPAFASFATIIESQFRAGEAETVRGIAAKPGSPAVQGDHHSWPELPGLQILGELGQGGMGIVYLAEQSAPRRRVAVKVLAAGIQSDSEARVRFRQEFESAARLGHENIVRVFQVGHHAGQDYCIQELVTGGNLKDWLRSRRLAPADAARLLLTLARAVAHAHERGVVHRDLKPANILLEPVRTFRGADIGPSGFEREALADSGNCSSTGRAAESASASGTSERSRLFAQPDLQSWHGFCPKVADFGLARRLDVTETAHTQSGAVLGTPYYMAPEQAGGSSRAVGPPADVYALGAVLFELLCGEPPHHGASLIEILDRVRREAVPKELIRAAPRDLQTICLKCLAAEPGNRYPDAGALADDLGRFVADRPIQARRAGWAERAIRWSRRERKVAALAALVGLLVVAGLAAFAISRGHQRSQAAARFQAALDELDSELQFIDREEFAVVSTMDSVRRDFLLRLANKSESLVAADPGLPLLNRQVARIHHQLGVIHELIGQHALAEAAYRRAISGCRAVLDSGSTKPGDWLEHSRFQFRLAKLLERTGQCTAAEELVNDARAGLANEAASGESTTMRGILLRQLGVWQAEKNDPTGAETPLREALALHTATDAGTGVNELNQSRVALATFLTAQCQLTPALELLDAAAADGEELVAADPHPAARSCLAQVLRARARARELEGMTEAGVTDLVRTHELFHQLAEQFPLRPEYRIEAGFALQALARHNQQLAGEKAAWQDVDLDEEIPPLEHRYRQALTLQEQLLAEFPDLVENRRRLAVTLGSLATWLQDKSTYLTDADQAQAARAEALTLHQRAERIWSGLAIEFPDRSELQNELARCHQRMGIVLVALGRLDEAKAGYQASIESQIRLVAEHPAGLAHPFILSALNNNLAVIADRQLDLPEAERLFRLAREQSDAVLALAPRYSTAVILNSNQSMNLVEVLTRLGKLDDAAAEFPRISKDWQPKWWATRPVFELGRDLVTAARQLSPEDRTADADRVQKIEILLLDEVAGMIARTDSAAAGLTPYLENDPLFDCLRRRPEFDDLIQQATRKFGAGDLP